MNVTLVTVTYGARSELLRTVLSACANQGVEKAIVVNNGSDPAAVAAAGQGLNIALDIVQMAGNTGSATGFAAGFDAALAKGAERILVLDDDNVPQPSALAELQSRLSSLVTEVGKSDAIVLGFRPDHQADVAEASTLARLIPHPDSFFGFCIQDIPRKLLKRTSFLRSFFRTPIQSSYRLANAPYSGMLMHTDVLKKYGLPKREMVLYVDDTEFTHRITSQGGVIELVTTAHISDLEASWSVKQLHGSTFKAFLHGGNDFRAFYSSRNQSYFERHCRKHNKSMRAVNKFVYMFILKAMALRDGKMDRYRLFANGIENGERGQLGVSAQFPLK